MKMTAWVIFVLLFLAQNPAKKPDGNDAQSQNKTDSSREAQTPVTVNCNQSTGAVADHHEGETPKWYATIEWSNWFLVLVAAATGYAIWQQTIATKQSVDVATRTLITSHRPKVIVRSVKLDPPATEFYDRRADGKWNIEVHLTNIGGTPANINECEVWFQMYSRQGVPIDTIATDWTQPPDHMLVPGGRYTLIGNVANGEKFRMSLHSIESSFASNNVQMRQPTCHGTISYRDGNGFERKTGFMREWKAGIQRFAVVDDPEHEYQD